MGGREVSRPYRVWFSPKASGCLFQEGAEMLFGIDDVGAVICHIPKRICHHVEWGRGYCQALDLIVERTFWSPEVAPCGAVALGVTAPRHGVGIDVNVADLQLVLVGKFLRPLGDAAHFVVVRTAVHPQIE